MDLKWGNIAFAYFQKNERKFILIGYHIYIISPTNESEQLQMKIKLFAFNLRASSMYD